MSNSFGRKSEFIPATYPRYFERPSNRNSHEHTYFDDKETDEQNSLSSNYQVKRDDLFKRLFPSKYSESNDDKEATTTNDGSVSLSNRKSNGAQSLGDFIPLPNDDNRPRKRRYSSSSSSSSSTSTSFSDFSVSSSENVASGNQIPSIKHESIVGHVHSRSTIEQVRSILIRDLYQRTSDPHTEWLKCKMELPRDFINPKYYADFQRRYRHEIRRKYDKTKKKSNSKKEKKDRPSKSKSSMKKTIVLDNSDATVDEEIIEIDSTEQTSTKAKKSKSKASESSTEFVVLDSDTDDNSDENNERKDSSGNGDDLFFIDRSSNSNKPFNKPSKVTKDDYIDEDSKYNQLPSRNKTNQKEIRPILSKHQRKKKNKSDDNRNRSESTPLVSAIDRIIDHMDQNDVLTDNAEHQKEKNEIIRTLKRRNKKKKKKQSPSEKSNE